MPRAVRSKRRSIRQRSKFWDMRRKADAATTKQSEADEHGAPARSGSGFATDAGPAPNNGLFKDGSRPTAVVK